MSPFETEGAREDEVSPDERALRRRLAAPGEEVPAGTGERQSRLRECGRGEQSAPGEVARVRVRQQFPHLVQHLRACRTTVRQRQASASRGDRQVRLTSATYSRVRPVLSRSALDELRNVSIVDA